MLIQTAWLVYDSILNADKEFYVVWRRPNVIGALYFIVRYVEIVSFLVVVMPMWKAAEVSAGSLRHCIQTEIRHHRPTTSKYFSVHATNRLL